MCGYYSPSSRPFSPREREFVGQGDSSVFCDSGIATYRLRRNVPFLHCASVMLEPFPQS